MGVWGLGSGQWRWGLGPSPQSAIPNPQSPIPINEVLIFCFNPRKILINQKNVSIIHLVNKELIH